MVLVLVLVRRQFVRSLIAFQSLLFQPLYFQLNPRTIRSVNYNIDRRPAIVIINHLGDILLVCFPLYFPLSWVAGARF